MSLHDQVIKKLKTINDKLAQNDIISANLVKGLKVDSHGIVSFVLEVNPAYANEGMKIRDQAQALLRSLPDVKDVRIVLTAQKKTKINNAAKVTLPGVKHIMAVASGKGGVGKSTMAVNLAYGFQAMGLKAGLLDGDIYGPSIPRMVGMNQRPTTNDNKTLNPVICHDLPCMSLGFMVEDKAATIWRGTMAQNAFRQMLLQVSWGDLDTLVIDLPPGTGDIQIALSQTVALSGAVIVSTPQDLALADACRGLEMFRKVEIPVLGLVENMSYFQCPHCDERSEIFEHGGVAREAKELGVELLAEIPLHMDIRAASEAGTPLVLADPKSVYAQMFKDLAKNVWEKVNLK